MLPPLRDDFLMEDMNELVYGSIRYREGSNGDVARSITLNVGDADFSNYIVGGINMSSLPLSTRRRISSLKRMGYTRIVVRKYRNWSVVPWIYFRKRCFEGWYHYRTGQWWLVLGTGVTPWHDSWS